MKDSNFYQISGWMINKLHLSGNELICYAIIYGFSQDDASMFMGSLSYLQQWMNVSQPTVINTLKSLVKKRLLIKHERVENKVRLCYYSIDSDTKEFLVGGTKEILVGGTKDSLVGGTKEILDNNNIDNNKIDNNKSCSNEQPKVDAFEVFWKIYRNGSKQSAIKAWNKLTDKERATAKDKVYEYLEYCKRSGRTLKDTSSYLNQKGFNEEWLVVPDSYKPADGDNESVANFKQYMCQGHAELIYHRNPLTYEQAVKIFNKYGTRQTEWAMTKLAERNIHQYYSIEQGIEAVMSDEEYEDEEG